MAVVKEPDLFKVGVPIVGITDLHQLYQDNSRVMPQLGYYFRTMMGDPVENAELWRDRSAITHAADLKAHLFMMHGTNDPRCPINQARGFRDALLANGRQKAVTSSTSNFPTRATARATSPERPAATAC